MSNTIIFIAVVGAVISLFLIPNTPISGTRIVLGTLGYDIEVLDAPVADSVMLDALSYVLTRTRFGPFIRRFLLDNNKISDLRELASQMDIPPMYFPMRRLSADKYNQLTSPEAVSETQQILINGFLPEFTEETTTAQNIPRTIAEYAAYYKQGHLPSEVMRKSLLAVHQWEAEGFRIFSSLHDDEVMAEARLSDLRWQSGAPLSAFDGVPVAFKDMMDVKGHTIYNGGNPSSAHASEWIVSDKDDLMVTRLRALGAIVFGVTITVEGGVSPLGYNAHFQGPTSAYHTNRYSGGSSSGSAVAVATGIVPVAIGYDGGGSVRSPASMSGIHGLATTFGRVPFANHTDSTMIKAGPLAASSQDVALAYAAIAPSAAGSFYTDMYDGGVLGPPAPHLAGFNDIQDLSDVRIGVFSQWFDDSEPLIRQRCYEAVAYLKQRGAVVVEVQIPHLRLMSLAHAMKISTEFAMSWDQHYYVHPDSMEPGGRIVVGLGATVSALESLAAEKIRAWAFEYVTALFEQHRLTCILSPTLGVEVPYLSERAKLRGESNTALSVKIMKYVFLANLLGLPGYTVPVGFVPAAPRPEDLDSAEGVMLPVGLHLLGDHWADHKLIRLAHSVEVGFSRLLPGRPQPLLHFHDPLQ